MHVWAGVCIGCQASKGDEACGIYWCGRFGLSFVQGVVRDQQLHVQLRLASLQQEPVYYTMTPV